MTDATDERTAENPVSIDADCSTVRPTFINVDQEVLRTGHTVAMLAIEHVGSLLAEHDATLGRTTRKNKMWAMSLEQDLAMVSRFRTACRECLGWDQ